jgi:hypothetical protein
VKTPATFSSSEIGFLDKHNVASKALKCEKEIVLASIELR